MKPGEMCSITAAHVNSHVWADLVRSASVYNGTPNQMQDGFAYCGIPCGHPSKSFSSFKTVPEKMLKYRPVADRLPRRLRGGLRLAFGATQNHTR